MGEVNLKIPLLDLLRNASTAAERLLLVALHYNGGRQAAASPR